MLHYFYRDLDAYSPSPLAGSPVLLASRGEVELCLVTSTTTAATSTGGRIAPCNNNTPVHSADYSMEDNPLTI